MKQDLLDTLRATKFRLENELTPPLPESIGTFAKAIEQYEGWLQHLRDLPPTQQDEEYLEAVDNYFWALNTLLEAHLQRFGAEVPVFLH
jgi:hypothetical protein